VIDPVSIDDISHVFDDVFLKTMSEEGAQIAPEMMIQTKAALASIAARIKSIAVMLKAGDVDASSAKTLLAMEQESISLHLLSVTGASKVLVQSAVNAAMNAIKAAVDALA
jgi:hypothetical protein